MATAEAVAVATVAAVAVATVATATVACKGREHPCGSLMPAPPGPQACFLVSVAPLPPAPPEAVAPPSQREKGEINLAPPWNILRSRRAKWGSVSSSILQIQSAMAAAATQAYHS